MVAVELVVLIVMIITVLQFVLLMDVMVTAPLDVL
jgi:hypothetical protein